LRHWMMHIVSVDVCDCLFRSCNCSLSNIIISVVVALVLVNSSFCNVPHWISVHMHEPVFYNIFPRFKNMGMFRFVLSKGILNLTNFQDKSSNILTLK
jgi:hypothetical protein